MKRRTGVVTKSVFMRKRDLVHQLVINDGFNTVLSSPVNLSSDKTGAGFISGTAGSRNLIAAPDVFP